MSRNQFHYKICWRLVDFDKIKIDSPHLFSVSIECIYVQFYEKQQMWVEPKIVIQGERISFTPLNKISTTYLYYTVNNRRLNIFIHHPGMPVFYVVGTIILYLYLYTQFFGSQKWWGADIVYTQNTFISIMLFFSIVGKYRLRLSYKWSIQI